MHKILFHVKYVRHDYMSTLVPDLFRRLISLVVATLPPFFPSFQTAGYNALEHDSVRETRVASNVVHANIHFPDVFQTVSQILI